MPIKTNRSTNRQLILITDTVLLQAGTSEIRAITFFSIAEIIGATETIELFTSPDDTSASGSLLKKITLGPKEDDQPEAALVSLAPGERLVAKGSIGSIVSADISYTLYNGNDAIV